MRFDRLNLKVIWQTNLIFFFQNFDYFNYLLIYVGGQEREEWPERQGACINHNKCNRNFERKKLNKINY